MNVLALSGSLRRDSLNTALLRAAAELAPQGVRVTLHDLRDVPLYDGDLGADPGVARLREAIVAADALLISTPEYNHSLSGVLKNALDWASRPAFTSPLAGKPAAVMSASPGAIGGARAQQHLKTILLATGTPVYPAAEVCVGGPGKFEGGRLVDEGTRAYVAKFLVGFGAWAERAR